MRERGHLDDGHVGALSPQIGDQADRAVVEQRADRENQRSRREDPWWDALDRPPRVAEDDLAGDQRVDDSVQLGRAERRLKPVQCSAEVDKRNAISAGQMCASQRGGCADGGIEGAGPAPAGLLERIDQKHDIARVLGMAFGYKEGVAPGRRTPIDLAHTVARRERADVGELDAVAARTGDMCPRGMAASAVVTPTPAVAAPAERLARPPSRLGASPTP